ncbi:MAG: hypothetical protein ACLTQL_03520 [Eisenbergiella sp.]
MSWITTYTGKHFDPVAPQEELLELRDIAHSLSLICRANGHMKHFYSVGQHSVAARRRRRQGGLSERIVLGCLLHDASEAYLSDVTRPIKHEMTRYLEVEETLQEMIWAHFIPGGAPDEEEKKAIFKIDDEMLAWEFERLMPELYGHGAEKICADISCAFAEMADVEREFMELYQKIAG